MSRLIVADTGPLVALFNEDDMAHRWALARFQEFTEPLVTCEAVLTETLHLLRKVPPAHFSLLALWERELLRIEFSAAREKDAIRRLLRRFDSVPISFADACLVRMSELHQDCAVWTLDSDFRVYRRSGRQSIPLLMPD
ncbi:MAG TPA: PIN domain-containing protein [Chthoniobacterales bacterium]|jgi:predicted nucleic acid-binding protein|nr:PIN domain-containing protein [Chthoniobacterales bacterium]